MNMFVETAETLKEQVETSTDRLKNLVGYDPKMVEQAKAMVASHPVVEKAEALKEKIESEVASNKFVKKAEKMSNKFKKQITETIVEVKDKIEDYTEDIKEKVDDVVGTEEDTPKKKVAKKTNKKATVVEKTKKVIVEKTDVVNDLKVIKGIGLKLEEALNKVGVTTYKQISDLPLEKLKSLLEKAGHNPNRYNLTSWKAEAKLVANK